MRIVIRNVSSLLLSPSFSLDIIRCWSSSVFIYNFITIFILTLARAVLYLVRRFFLCECVSFRIFCLFMFWLGSFGPIARFEFERSIRQLVVCRYCIRTGFSCLACYLNGINSSDRWNVCTYWFYREEIVQSFFAFFLVVCDDRKIFDRERCVYWFLKCHCTKAINNAFEMVVLYLICLFDSLTSHCLKLINRFIYCLPMKGQKCFFFSLSRRQKKKPTIIQLFWLYQQFKSFDKSPITIATQHNSNAVWNQSNN